MRRFVFGLPIVLLALGLFLSAGCQRANVLRVAAVNQGTPVYCDIADWGVYSDPTDPEAEPEWIYAIQDEVAEFEFQYLEVGPGLPTWTPYQAVIKEYSLTYQTQSNSGNTYVGATIPLTFTLIADPDGKKSTKAKLVVASSWWKQEYFGDEIGGEPTTDFELLDILWTQVDFSAVDSISGKNIKGQATLQMQVGDFWDDPQRIGQ